MTGHDSRDNNFGLLRLIFAALVVVSHAPEAVDGDRSREILTRLFGTLSFGEAAVDGFFLISGYLITRSFVESRSVVSYLRKRVARIVPGYGVSFWLCVLVLGPFVGAPELNVPLAVEALTQTIVLSQPLIPGVFPGLHYPLLNGPMWTIAYEFKCYLAVALLGVLGVVTPRHRWILLAAVAVLSILNGTSAFSGFEPGWSMLLGTPSLLVKFGGVFGTGMIFYLFRDKIGFTHGGAAVAAALLGVLMFYPALAEAGFAIFGGYLIFWAAFRIRVLAVSRFANRTDLSYGLYLYAWPVANLAIWLHPTIDPWALCAGTLLTASLCAYASWMLVESPCLRLARPGD